MHMICPNSYPTSPVAVRGVEANHGVLTSTEGRAGKASWKEAVVEMRLETSIHTRVYIAQPGHT